MMLFLISCVLLLVLYLVSKVASIEKRQRSIAEFLEAQIKELKARQEIPPKPLAYGWFDDGWPVPKTEEEERSPLGNPEPQRNPDDYQTQMWMREYHSLPTAHARIEFLRDLFTARARIRPEFRDLIYADESAYVRAWAAAHLHLHFNYERNLLNDPDPLVRGAVWSNPECNRLPWGPIHLSDDWKARFRGMGSLERLGLMRNPGLPANYVLALLEAPSEELGISREEHKRILMTATVNPDLVGRSRWTGRDSWEGEFGDAFPACEEYGKMWELGLQKWSDALVPYFLIKYVQATPEVKLTTYNRLLESCDGNEVLRREVIRSCDPVKDRKVLKLAWNDPDEGCRKLAAERIGPFTQVVGIKKEGARSVRDHAR